MRLPLTKFALAVFLLASAIALVAHGNAFFKQKRAQEILSNCDEPPPKIWVDPDSGMRFRSLPVCPQIPEYHAIADGAETRSIYMDLSRYTLKYSMIFLAVVALMESFVKGVFPWLRGDDSAPKR